MGGDEDEAGVVSITGTLICLVIDLKGDKNSIVYHLPFVHFPLDFGTFPRRF